MNIYIENYILSWPVCLKFSKSKTKKPISAHNIPDIPFYKIVMDTAEFGNVSYLIAIDYYSKWLELLNSNIRPVMLLFLF